MYVRTSPTTPPVTPPAIACVAVPFPAPPLGSPAPKAPPEPDELPGSRSSGLYEALAAARELTLTPPRLTRGEGRGEPIELAAELRRTTAAVALGLEARTALSLLGAVHALWRTAELIDRAERKGLLDLGEAMELLALGSRVEIPLVSFLRRCGMERALSPGGEPSE